jgi:predicted anti-sigma-YlaC factor YlaD
VKHFSDSQIQDFLDNRLSGQEAAAFRKHVDNCAECRVQLDLYSRLYQGLEREVGYKISALSKKEVIREIKAETLGSVHGRLWHIFLVLFGVIIAVNISLYYFDVGALFGKMDMKSQLNFDYVKTLVSYLESIFQTLNVNILLVAGSVCVILFIALIDRLVFQHKGKVAPFHS